MTIKTIDKDGISESEVLAFGYQNIMLIGRCTKSITNSNEGTICYDDEGTVLTNIKAYILTSDLEKEFLKSLHNNL